MANLTTDQAATHDYTIQAGGRTYSGDVVLDVNRPLTHNQTSAEQSIPAVEQTAVNTFITALGTLFTSLRDVTSVTVTPRSTASQLKKTP